MCNANAELQESSMKISTSVLVEPSTILTANPTTTISQSLKEPRASRAAKFYISHVSPLPTTTASVRLQPTPAENSFECNCQLRLDKLTPKALLEDLQLLIVLSVLFLLCLLLCCFTTACCVQCCAIRRHKCRSSSKDSSASDTNPAKAPSDENIYCDIAENPPAARKHRRPRNATSKKHSTGSLHELAAYTDGPQYCNTGVHRQNASYPSNTF